MSDMERHAYEERIEALEDTCTKLQQGYTDMQNMICFMVQKFGSPVILTERDIVGMPMGRLVVQTDEPTGSILISFEAETSTDSIPAQHTNTTGPE